MVGRGEDARVELLREAQSGVPLESRPFLALGRRVGLDERETLDGLRELAGQGRLREISAVLEGEAFGWESALCTAEITAAEVERVAAVVDAHPTVTHDYVRDHRLNLWFTLAVPPEMGLVPTLDLLAAEAGVPGFHALRRTATFKIGVRFDPRTLCNDTAIERRRPVRRVVPDERGRRLFRALQSPLPLEERAFAALAAGHGLDEAELLAFGRAHLGGAVRRYVATLRHRQLGVRANGMVVWRVGEDRLRRAGEALARAPEVSHCYARESAPGFPYTLYSMVHGPDEAACRTIATRLAADAGLDDHLVLFSRRELKKCRLRYFLPELDDWWRARATEAATPGTGSKP